ncbi:MAG: DUF420 domain-containing protein [Planctomycetota bacterium]
MPESPLTFDDAPAWVAALPAVNASLNALATVALCGGYIAIRSGRARVHKRFMLAAFLTSVVFLASYLTYHSALFATTGLRGKPFEGEGVIRPIYFSILISHVLLAAAVPVLAIGSIGFALFGRWRTHRRWSRVTFPVWVYVSVTGVVVYWMLYRMA